MRPSAQSPSRMLAFAVGALSALFLADVVEAQAVGAGANLGFYNLNGDPFEEVDGGFGFEAFLQLSPGGGGGGAPPMGAAGPGGAMGFGGGGFSLGIGIKRTFHETEAGDEVDTRTIFIAPGLDLSPARSRVRLSVRTRLSPFARVDFGQDAEGRRLQSDGFEVGGAVGSEIFLLSWLAVEPSVYGSYLNLEDPASEPDQQQPFPLPGFGTGDRLQGWSLGFRLGLNLLVR